MTSKRIWIYVVIALISIYLTWMAITNTEVENFTFGYIDFSKDEVSNYSSLISVIFGLLGVILLIETLWLQWKQYKADEKAKLKDEKLDWYYKLKLLSVDLGLIVSDIKQKSEKIKEYFELEKKHPFQTNLLFRTSSRNYSRILELDRLSIYKGFYNFFGYKEDWLKKFNNLYNNLDFLPDAIKEIYQMYDRHSRDIFNRKTEVQQDLIKVMNLGSSILTDYKMKGIENYLDQPASKITNEMMKRYYDILNESYDENGNVISETNLKRIGDEVLLPFIKQVVEQREKVENFDRTLEPISELCANIRKKIYSIETTSVTFANNMEIQYNQINVSTKESKSTLDSISEIKGFIDEELNKIDPEKL